MNQNFDTLLEIARQLILLDANEEEHKASGQWKEGKRAYDALAEEFRKVRQDFIDDVLATPDGHATAVQQTEAHLKSLRDGSDPSWEPVFDYLENNLLNDLKKEARRSPKTRKVLKALPYVAGAFAVAAYFGTAVVYRVNVTDPLETRAGLEQRADALGKVLLYDDWADAKVRRGGWVKGLLLWPIEPNEQEVQAGAELAGLALEAANVVQQEHGCPILYAGGEDEISEQQIEYLEKITERLKATGTRWVDPPVMTLVQEARAVRGC
jgi:hypothetical protein